MSYSKLIVRTSAGAVETAVCPTELFNDDAVANFIQDVRVQKQARIDGYEVREIATETDNVHWLDDYRF